MAMDMNDLLNSVESRAPQPGKKHPDFEIGDVVDVGVRIAEGDKTRVQVFNGRVIAKRGGGLRSTFTVRRIVDNEGVERDFPLHSPMIEFVRVKLHGRARRAKLFFLRERVGKQTRLREVVLGEEAAVPAEGAAAAPQQRKGKKRGAKAKAERQARAGEMAAQKAEARRKKRAAKKAEKAGAEAKQ